MADTFKQVMIHKKYMVSGGIGPIFGGKVALTRLGPLRRRAGRQGRGGGAGRRAGAAGGEQGGEE